MSTKQNKQQTNDKIEFDNFKTLGAKLFTAFGDQWLTGKELLKTTRLKVSKTYNSEDDFLKAAGIDFILASNEVVDDATRENMLCYLRRGDLRKDTIEFFATDFDEYYTYIELENKLVGIIPADHPLA